MLNPIRLKRYMPLYIMMAPAIIFFLIYHYMPMYGVIIGFKDFRFSKGISGSPWAKPFFKHLLIFYRSPYFWQLLGNTFIISFQKLIWGIFPPIILALLLNECRVGWFKKSVQTISYMPHFLSWVIIQGILIAFLSEDMGVINRFLRDLNGDMVPFLRSESWFRPLVIITSIWKDMGWGAIIYLAALAGIDPTLYDAGKIDGCTRIKMIRHITLPSIVNIIIMLLTLRLGRLMNAGFEQIYVMYNPHVYSVGDIIDTWVYRTGLEQLNFSLASIVGLFKSFIGFFLVISTNKIAKNWGENLW